jgi:hypothetical protein
MGAGDLAKDPSVVRSRTYANPADARFLPNDWIVTSSGHAGWVNANGRINHYLQVPGEIGKFRPDYKVLPPAVKRRPGVEYRPGGEYFNNDMEEFLNAGYRRQPGVTVTVLRRR